jgi:ferredoxin
VQQQRRQQQTALRTQPATRTKRKPLSRGAVLGAVAAAVSCGIMCMACLAVCPAAVVDKLSVSSSSSSSRLILTSGVWVAFDAAGSAERMAADQVQ